jgi:centractin
MDTDADCAVQLLLRRAGRNMTTSAEFEIVRQMKEQCCYVAFDPVKEEEKGRHLQKRQYQLPDGSMVDMGAEAFRAPEILFQPDLIGSESRGMVCC